MNFDGILKACEQAGARYLLVEQLSESGGQGKR